ncbi:cytochrome c oxidase subunit 2A [Paenibacillus sp. GD4]|nr:MULTISPECIES: cytochrome c oxidase subunit 2A [Paenibacillus]MDQ1912264.1 cytochrome c oxidase subunit 2A [Paenibacillus sp. GD4]
MPPQHKEPELKGAFASVMLLGAFLVLTWVGAYVLFISRG